MRIWLFAAAAICSVNVNAAVMFFDNTFLDSHWVSQVVMHDGLISGAVLGQAPTGGNDGAHRQHTATAHGIAGGETAQYAVANINTTFLYDPSLHGAIDSIRFDYDISVIETTISTSAEWFRPFVRQGGVLFQLHNTNDLAPIGSWASFTHVANSMSTWTAILSPGILLDLSGSAAPIEFGYRIRTGLNCPAAIGSNCVESTSVAGIDNFRVTITSLANPVMPVPLPTTPLLFAMGLLALGVARRRC